MALAVKRFLTAVNAANSYLCWCSATREAVIVDPAEFTPGMKAAVEERGVELKAIYITHGHYDHTAAAAEVGRAYGIPTFAAGDQAGATVVGDGDALRLGEENIRVAAVPGHTEDSVAFIGAGLAFVGDALFAAAVGGTGSRVAFERQVAGVGRQLLSLPAETILYTGHGPATTVAVERCYNPFFI